MLCVHLIKARTIESQANSQYLVMMDHLKFANLSNFLLAVVFQWVTQMNHFLRRKILLQLSNSLQTFCHQLTETSENYFVYIKAYQYHCHGMLNVFLTLENFVHD